MATNFNNTNNSLNDDDEIPLNRKYDNFNSSNSLKDSLEPKKAYIERALYSYLKNFFVQGYKRLMERQYRGFFFYILLMISATTIMNILYAIELITDINLMYHITLVCIFTGISYILGGFIGGIIKNNHLQSIITVCLNLVIIIGEVFLILSGNIIIYSSSIWLEIIKVIFFFSYVCIGTISFFFIIISFITSISYRLINLGNSPDRILFQGILRLILWISIPMYGYLIYQGSLDAQLLGFGGIIVVCIMIYQFYHLPTIKSAKKFTEKVDVKAKINYIQVLGFYYVYLLYHLSKSFSVDSSIEISNLTLTFILLTINTIFMINTLSKKVDNIQDSEDLQRAFMFQRKTGISVKIKQFIGERGLILMMLGLAIGYFAVYLDSYLGNNLKLVLVISNVSREASPNATYNRMFLGLGLIVIVTTMIVFNRSAKFQGIFVNRYTFRHVLKMFGDLFRINDDGNTGHILKSVIQSKNAVNNGISSMKKGIKKGWNALFTLGKQKQSLDEDEDKE